MDTILNFSDISEMSWNSQPLLTWTVNTIRNFNTAACRHLRGIKCVRHESS